MIRSKRSLAAISNVDWSTSVLFAMSLGVSGCVRYRTLPVSEAPKVSYEHVPASGGVVVDDVEGQRIYIEHFRFVEVLFYRCQPVQHGKLLSCRDERVRYTAPVYLRHENGLLLVVPNSADPRNTQPRWFDTAYSIRIVDRSSSRGLVMAGTAVATFALVGLGASYLASQFSNDPHGYQPLFLGLFVGGGAGGASLLITGPLTRDLGTPVR